MLTQSPGFTEQMCRRVFQELVLAVSVAATCFQEGGAETPTMSSLESFSLHRKDDSDRARPSTQDGNTGQTLMTVSTPPTRRVTCVPTGWFPLAASVLINREFDSEKAYRL